MKLAVRLCCLKPLDAHPFVGFVIEIPLGKSQIDNEASGFGVRYQRKERDQCELYFANGKAAHRASDTIVAFDRHWITVHFPRGHLQTLVEKAPKSLADRFPDAKGKDKGMTLINFNLGAAPTVYSFGVPFRSSDGEVDGWVNDNKPIVDGHTLLDVLRQRHLYFVLAMAPADALKHYSSDRLPPLFIYPYSEDQSWNLARFKKEMAASKGHQFNKAFGYSDDRSHVTVVTQSIVQDIAWIHDAAEEIKAVRFPVYFVPPTSGDAAAATSFTVIVSVTKKFREQFEGPLRRLTKSEFLNLDLFNSFEDAEVYESWKGKILAYPNLQDHPADKHEMVLRVLRPKEEKETKKPKKEPYRVKTFSDRAMANRALQISKEQ
ncbi:hypothetical protein NW767_010835 [Fusarium falciforme]|nr:hypothetical protein NW767_010835 [Fusarium falciforme]